MMGWGIVLDEKVHGDIHFKLVFRLAPSEDSLIIASFADIYVYQDSQLVLNVKPCLEIKFLT